MKFDRAPFLLFLFLYAMAPIGSFAQVKKHHRQGKIYFSWGYNMEWFTKSNVHVSQPEIGNNYTFENITGNDHPGWNDDFLNRPITIPQYNYRMGYIFDRLKGLGFEINFDHTKFIFADQNAKIQGTLNHRPVDSTIAFNSNNGFYYFLNNGANFLLLNLVKRWHIFQLSNQKLLIDLLGKGGIGPVIPHVENSFFGHPNNEHFQLGGWNIGGEAALRITGFKYIYLEYSNKLDYARYSGLKIYDGTAKQAFGTYEMVLSLGLTLPVGKVLP